MRRSSGAGPDFGLGLAKLGPRALRRGLEAGREAPGSAEDRVVLLQQGVVDLRRVPRRIVHRTPCTFWRRRRRPVENHGAYPGQLVPQLGADFRICQKERATNNQRINLGDL